MLTALTVSICAIIVAPWIGRWRANAFIRHLFADQAVRSHAHAGESPMPLEAKHARIPAQR